jgi:molybdopterin/thiamine biosynthesis adenylyltransferase
MADLDTLRHSRHALLDGLDEDGVQHIQQSRVLIIGAGGLGCPAATYLAASGVGTLHWADGDVVDATNLARQTLFGPSDIGAPKVAAGIAALQRLNPNVNFIAAHQFADAAFLNDAVPKADVVLDCTDQWPIRQLINAACVTHNIPLVTAAAIEWSGQLLSINPGNPSDACYACVFDPACAPDAHACGAYGVLAPMVGAMGCLQAAEALKMLLIRAGKGLSASAPQRLSLLDIKTGSWQQLMVAKNPDCPVCGPKKNKG